MTYSKKVGTAAILLAIGLLFAAGYSAGEEPAKKLTFVQRVLGAQQIALACRRYAVKNEGAYPVLLDVLFPKYLPDRIISLPLAPVPGSVDYEYFGNGLSDTSRPDRVLMRERSADEDGRRVAVRLDAVVVVEQK